MIVLLLHKNSTMNRRYFLQSTAILTASSIFPMNSVMAKSNRLKSIGVQLFSLPRLLEKDFRNAIKILAQIGVEIKNSYQNSWRLIYLRFTTFLIRFI